MKTHSYNELKECFFINREEWMPISLLPLVSNIDPDEKIYTDKQFRWLKDFFSSRNLDNPLCKRINCFDINLNHTHSKPETKEEYQERIIRLLEEWKEHNDNIEITGLEEQKFFEKEMSKLVKIITFLKEKHDFKEKIAKLSDYFDNSLTSSFSKSQLLFELEKRCQNLLEKDKEDQNHQKGQGDRNNWIKKFFASPWTWFGLLLVIVLIIIMIIAYKRKRN